MAVSKIARRYNAVIKINILFCFAKDVFNNSYSKIRDIRPYCYFLMVYYAIIITGE